VARTDGLLDAVRKAASGAFVTDTAPLIFRIERRAHSPLVRACDSLFDAVEQGDLSCVVGAVSVAEALVMPLRSGPPALVAVDTFLRQPAVAVGNVTEPIARVGADLLASGVIGRLADALVVATAYDLGLPLVTADRRLARSGVVEALLVQDFA